MSSEPFGSEPVGLQNAVAEQHSEFGEVAGRRGRIHRVDGRGIAGGAIDEQHRRTQRLSR